MEELVRQSLAEITATKSNEWQGSLCLPSEAPLFKGHFPSRPIVPGVILVEAVRQMAARALTIPVDISFIKQVKFKDLVVPNETIAILLTIIPEGSNYHLTANLRSGDILKAKLILTLSPAQ